MKIALGKCDIRCLSDGPTPVRSRYELARRTSTNRSYHSAHATISFGTLLSQRLRNYASVKKSYFHYWVNYCTRKRTIDQPSFRKNLSLSKIFHCLLSHCSTYLQLFQGIVSFPDTISKPPMRGPGAIPSTRPNRDFGVVDLCTCLYLQVSSLPLNSSAEHIHYSI